MSANDLIVIILAGLAVLAFIAGIVFLGGYVLAEMDKLKE